MTVAYDDALVRKIDKTARKVGPRKVMSEADRIKIVQAMMLCKYCQPVPHAAVQLLLRWVKILGEKKWFDFIDKQNEITRKATEEMKFPPNKKPWIKTFFSKQSLMAMRTDSEANSPDLTAGESDSDY